MSEQWLYCIRGTARDGDDRTSDGRPTDKVGRLIGLKFNYTSVDMSPESTGMPKTTTPSAKGDHLTICPATVGAENLLCWLLQHGLSQIKKILEEIFLDETGFGSIACWACSQDILLHMGKVGEIRLTMMMMMRRIRC